MHEEDLRQYVCPQCGAPQLDLQATLRADNGEVVEGQLRCTPCAQAYPIRGHLPRFVPASNYADSFGYQWNLHAKTQLDSHTGLPISRDRVFGVTQWPAHLAGERILEAGSGAGRFTEVLLSTGADVHTFDYSSAADANWASNQGKGRLHLFQGDIFQIPFAPGGFDKVICLGVLQHTPDPARAFRSLAKQVRVGGQLAIDVYTRSFVHGLQWKYLLRPITRRMAPTTLYRCISAVAPPLVPVAALARRLFGRAGARLVPIVEYGHLGLPAELNRQWAVLDTFDLYSPAHDHPQSLRTVQEWYSSEGFEPVSVRPGPNGVVAVGTKH